MDIYADENEPKTSFFATIYTVTVGRDIRVLVAVDETGYCWIENDSWWLGKFYKRLDIVERKEAIDWLVEWELAKWKKVGPDDRELFATDKLIGE